MAVRKSILIFANSEYGQSNVMLAVVYELLFQGEFDIHIASFPSLKQRLNELLATLTSKEATRLTFHGLPGRAMLEVVNSQRGDEFGKPHRPGIQGSIESYGEIHEYYCSMGRPGVRRGL